MAIDESKTLVPQQTGALAIIGKQLRLKKKILSAREIVATVEEFHVDAAGVQPNGFFNCADLEIKIKPRTGIKTDLKKRSHQEIYLDFVDTSGSSKLSLDFCFIPSGSFKMGGMGWWDEVPSHWVTINRDFYLGKFPITQDQWEAVMGSNPSKVNGAYRAVDSVSWNDCQEFVSRLNGFGKGTFRMPTEAEWDYACQAGTGKISGEMIWPNTSDYSSFFDKSEDANYQEAKWGLYGMVGNVWEWCQDWWGSYSVESVTDPQGALSGTYRVVLGGPWFDDHRFFGRDDCYRSKNSPDYRDYDTGFRLAFLPDDELD